MIIITGGAGFIGSNLVHTLAAESRGPLVVVDQFGVNDKWQNLKNVPLFDIVEPKNCFSYLDAQVQAITHIIHLGAISTTTEPDVDLIIDNNFATSRRLLTWCTVHQKPLIYASSAATYGSGAQGFIDFENLLSLRALTPLNAYAWSKHLFDQLIAQYRETGQPLPPQIVGLKFFNVYGPNEYHKGSQMSVINQIYHQVKDRVSAAKLFKSYDPNYPDGGQLRDFIWVDDCCAVIQFFLNNPHLSGLFNVGTGVARTFNDLAHSVFTALNLKPTINYHDMPAVLRQQYQYYTQADMIKLREVGYHNPFTTLEGGVKQYLDHFLTQQDNYR